VEFLLSEDEIALRDSIRAQLAQTHSLDHLRGLEGSAAVADVAAWASLEDTGVLSLLVPEDRGGVGLGLTAAVVVFEELGRRLVPGPLIGSTLLAGTSLGAKRIGLVESPAIGASLPTAVDCPGDLEIVAFLPHPSDPHGPITSASPAALNLEIVESLDPLNPLGYFHGEVKDAAMLEDAPAADLLRRQAALLSAAYSVGMASEVLELAVDYAKGREQFARPIGSFQAIKHLLADCLTKAEAARCAVQFAAALHDQEDVAVAEAEVMGMSTGQMLWRLSAGAKLLADEAAIANARTAVQVYGGMGFTWEVPIHLYLKRARVLATRFGNRKAMAETVAALY